MRNPGRGPSPASRERPSCLATLVSTTPETLSWPGRGWIAIVVVIFARWSPYKAIAGSWLFGLGYSIAAILHRLWPILEPRTRVGLLPAGDTVHLRHRLHTGLSQGNQIPIVPYGSLQAQVAKGSGRCSFLGLHILRCRNRVYP